MYSRKVGVHGLKIVNAKLVVAYVVFYQSNLGDILPICNISPALNKVI